ncbi:hypothetical protein LTR17_011853 [Elasticomyces elasticus]|nr:hypothetical protein LTR17_011853 [Elasticomyces elasticus]
MSDLLLNALEVSTYVPKQPQNEEVADLRIRLEQTQHQVLELQACVQHLSQPDDLDLEYIQRKHSRTASSSSLSSLAESDFIGACTAAAERSNIFGPIITESNGAVHDNDAQTTSHPPFPFRAIVERNDDGSPKLLDFGELSDGLAEDIVRLAATWEHTCAKKLSKEWPTILKSVLRTKIQCAWNRIEIGGNSHWTVNEPGYLACKKCAKISRYCFKQHDGKLYLLPLPAAVAESSDPPEAGYYRQTNAQASSREFKNEWAKLWRYA